VPRPKNNQRIKYAHHLSNKQRRQVCDVLLLKEMKNQLDEHSGVPDGNTSSNKANHESSSSDSSLLVLSLELVALEKLIAFRQVMVRDLHSEQFPILNEFEALYSYKCGLFEECLEMSQSCELVASCQLYQKPALCDSVAGVCFSV